MSSKNNNEEKDQLEVNNTKPIQQINLLDVNIDNENKALNVLIGFLNVAQKRGCFAINESAKINDCIKMFMK